MNLLVQRFPVKINESQIQKMLCKITSENSEKYQFVFMLVYARKKLHYITITGKGRQALSLKRRAC